MNWRIHHREVTVSTNLDARGGVPGDVFTADEQTAGRGRLDHAWQSPRGANLMFSAVLDIADLEPAVVVTLPLVVGLAVLRALRQILLPSAFQLSPFTLKWPNDVLVNGRKICGILCERQGDNVIAGVGINVNQLVFPEELRERATSLLKEVGEKGRMGEGSNAEGRATRRRGERGTDGFVVGDVLVGVLKEIGALYDVWREKGFVAVWPELAAVDHLKGKAVRVFAVDGDPEPLTGICGGVCVDGTLDVGGQAVYAGEAHVAAVGG